MVDIEEGQDFVDLFVHRPGRKRVIASSVGNGFVVAEDELVANTRKGKQVLNVSGTEEAKLIVPAEGDSVAIIGENRKMLIFPATELPEMARGKGVRLQKYKDGGVSDAQDLRNEGRSHLGRLLRPHLHQADGRAPRLGRRTRPGRPPAAEGFSAQQQVCGLGDVALRRLDRSDLRFVIPCGHRRADLAAEESHSKRRDMGQQPLGRIGLVFADDGVGLAAAVIAFDGYLMPEPHVRFVFQVRARFRYWRGAPRRVAQVAGDLGKAPLIVIGACSAQHHLQPVDFRDDQVKATAGHPVGMGADRALVQLLAGRRPPAP